MPFVTLACICEKALQEKDGVISVIRVVDIFNVQMQKNSPGDLNLGVDFTVAVVLKAGALKGQSAAWLSLRYPSGRTRKLVEPQPIVFKGDENGFSLIVHTILKVEELGLFWCDVIWEQKILTSIPFRLRQIEEQPQSSS